MRDGAVREGDGERVLGCSNHDIRRVSSSCASATRRGTGTGGLAIEEFAPVDLSRFQFNRDDMPETLV